MKQGKPLTWVTSKGNCILSNCEVFANIHQLYINVNILCPILLKTYVPCTYPLFCNILGGYWNILFIPWYKYHLSITQHFCRFYLTFIQGETETKFKQNYINRALINSSLTNSWLLFQSLYGILYMFRSYIAFIFLYNKF